MTWQRKRKSTSPSWAPVPPAPSLRTCSRAPARRSCSSSSDPTGTTSSSSRSEIWGKRLKHAPRFQLAGRHNPGHGSNAGWGTGGAMLHFFANFPRLHPDDFRVKSKYGKGLDWPISYDDLSPYYDRIAAGRRRLRRRGGRATLVSGRQGLPDAAAEDVPARSHLQRRVQGSRHSAGADAGVHQQHRLQRPAGLRELRLVPCRLRHRRARHAAGKPSAGGAQARRRGAALQLCDTRAHQRQRRPRHRGRVLRRQARAARAARRDRRARRLFGGNPAHPVQLRDRQAPEGSCEPQRAGRQISDVPPDLDGVGDVRRGRPEPHGHRRLSIHVVRALRQEARQEGLRQHLHSDRFGVEAELPASRDPGPTCSASRSPTT